MLSRLGIIITLALALLLFLWLGPQQSLSNTPAGSTSPSGTNGAVALNPSDTKHSTPNPGQAKKATPTPTSSYPVLPSLPPGFSPTPTPNPTPTPTPGATVTPTPTPTPAPTPTPGPIASFTYSPANPVTGQAVSFNASGSSCAALPCAYIWSDDYDGSILGGGVTMSFTFHDVGTKYARLTITDGLGRQATVEHNVVVGAGPSPTPTPTPIPTASPTPTATPKPTVTPTPTPTATPAPTPTPTPSAGTLTWRPPACGDATHTCATLQLSNTGSHQYLRLDSSKDWIVNLPNVPLVGGIDIDGGHSVIIIGGEIDLPLNCTGDNGACHGINVSLSSPSTGELFVEGLLIKNQDATNAAYTGDGVTVDVNAFANITLENLRIQGISGCDSGAYPSAHADVVQPYGAANTVIQIDHLTGSTNYQGMQIDPDMRTPKSGDFRNVNINVLSNPHTGCAGSGPRYGWWMTYGLNTCTTYPKNLVNDYLQEPNGSLQTNAVWPDTDASYGCPAVYSNGMVTWPKIPAITGGIHNGLPAGGDFVPVGRAGLSYKSPGYQ